MRTVEISHRTIIFAVLLLGFVWALVQIKDIITSLFVAILLSTALNPLVERLTRFKVPRGFAILFVYILFIGLLSLSAWGLVPVVIDESSKLVNRSPHLFDSVVSFFGSVGITGIDAKALASQFSLLGELPANIVRFTTSFFSNLVSVLTVFIITFYLLLERRNLDKYTAYFFGQGYGVRARDFVDKLEARLGGWVRGELTLMFIVGLFTYIGLTVLHIPFALPLALLAGIFEIIPNIGPVVAAVPAVLLALTVSPIMGVAAASLYFLIQQVENSILVPKVMQKAVGVNPLVIILSLAVGFELAGALGAILAVPVVITCQVVYLEVLEARKAGVEK